MEPYIGQLKDVILGQDFLTWLWFKSEVNGGRFQTASNELFNIYVAERVSVRGGEGETLETATVSGPMSELKEARLGLSTGKKVNRALVRMEIGPDSWQTVLKADDFAISSLKTPAIDPGQEQDDDPDAKFLEKAYLVERFLEFLDQVFAQFLALRFGSDWPQEVARVREWLNTNP